MQIEQTGEQPLSGRAERDVLRTRTENQTAITLPPSAPNSDKGWKR